MDAQLSSNLEDLEKFFTSRMAEYDRKLEGMKTGPAANPDIVTLSREYTEFKSVIWGAISRIKTQLELLTLAQDRHEMVMRRKVLLFHGLPEERNENLNDSVLRVISVKLKLPDFPRDKLQACHRLGSPGSKPRPVLVRFAAMEHRHHVWDNKTGLKGSGITMSEFLTRPRHLAFTTARKHFGIKSCWSVEGRIVVLLPDKTRRKVDTLAEVKKLIEDYPSATGMTGTGGTESSQQVYRKTRRHK
ncbi:uncharacterized protein LOC132904088 [Amyelois transitella]|uniref:uncharacterized protein LOC132904088 n=1 Tax=Amyelois transitella TaxID=680683 RepID=UPI002990498D|nr:uncharacterized protein LOC132904088 [Amyelois transitella]